MDMLLNRKPQNQDQDKNWCIVLNQSSSLMDQKRIAHKISEIFSLTLEEASDLVRSTPIILLDNLSKTVALKLRDFLVKYGADITLTKDTLFKRKCYRTVWPHPPSLSFLHLEEKEEESFEPPVGREVASKTSFETSSVESQQPAKLHSETFPSQEKKPVWDAPKPAEPARDWKWKTPSFPETPAAAASSPSVPTRQERDEAFAKYESELRQAKGSIKNLEEKYEALKEEYREARSVYEEKLIQARKESEQYRKKADEHFSRSQLVQKELQRLDIEIREREKQFQQLQEEVKQVEEKLQYEKSLRHQEAERTKLLVQESDLKLQTLDGLKNQLQAALGEQQTQIASLKDRCQVLEVQVEEALKRAQNEKQIREQAEAHIKELEAYHEKEAQLRQHEKGEWRQHYEVLDQKIASTQDFLKHQQSTLETILKRLEDIQTVASRPHQAAPQISGEAGASHKPHDAKNALHEEEQKKVMQKLQEKETLLQQLVHEQEKIEKEICDREESMRKLISDQESVEKEIVEFRHLQQRHWSDSIKF